MRHLNPVAALLFCLAIAGCDGATAPPAAIVQAYVCPMHPTAVASAPGECPICGMDLEARAAASGIAVAPAAEQALGLAVQPLARRTLTRSARALARASDATVPGPPVTATVDGRIASMRVTEIGRRVKQGELLLEIESSGGASLEVRAPRDGAIAAVQVLPGREVGVGEQLYVLGEPRPARAFGRLPERDAHGLATGGAATVELADGARVPGTLFFLSAQIEPRTRTLDFGVEFEAGAAPVRNNSTLTVRVETGRVENALALPRQAIVDTGERRLAFVRTAAGRFEPREVHTGLESDDGFVEVLDGLAEGEPVVVSGQFLLDAESNVQAAIARQLAADPAAQRR